MSAAVLIVDDSVSVRKSLSQILTQHGYEVEEAVDGLDALAKLDAGIFDCVITDVNMPNMDGLEFIRHARTVEKGRYIPILVLTTEAQSDMIRAGRKAGATGWIIKPFNDVKLLTAVRKVLANG